MNLAAERVWILSSSNGKETILPEVSSDSKLPQLRVLVGTACLCASVYVDKILDKQLMKLKRAGMDGKMLFDHYTYLYRAEVGW